MGKKQVQVTLVVGCAVLAVASGAFAARAAFGPPPSGPRLEGMPLAASDLGSAAKVQRQGYVEPEADIGILAEYDRYFKRGTTSLGSRKLLLVESDSILMRNTKAANQLLLAFALAVSGIEPKDVRSSFKELGLHPTYVKLGSAFDLHSGDDSFGMRIRVGSPAGELHYVFCIVRTGRVISVFAVIGKPHTRLGLAESRRLAGLVTAHVRLNLAPTSFAPPTLTGAAQVGQVLISTPGTWFNGPAFTYEWRRCDLSAGSCTAIAGATSGSYTLTTDDVGSTVVLAIKGTNRYGTTTGVSLPTAPVSALGAPVSTAPPTIAGTASAGQTLTATAGAWAGAPTAYSYQWRRCGSTGTGCSDVTGATGLTYGVTAADSGSTLRVVVKATNSVGPGLGVSAATKTVA